MPRVGRQRGATATVPSSASGECWPIMRVEFARPVRSGAPYELDVCRCLRLQELVGAAQSPVRCVG